MGSGRLVLPALVALLWICSCAKEVPGIPDAPPVPDSSVPMIPLEPADTVQPLIPLEPAKPVELTGPVMLRTEGGKRQIESDGVDAVTFLVEQNGVNVTDMSVIYRNMDIFGAEPIEGNVFTSKRPGSYAFYAEKDGKRTDMVYIDVIPATETDGDGNIRNGRLFCKHVSIGSGWYDVNKVGNGTINNDGLLCWAAAASNMLQWWLEDFKLKGHDLPESVPFGKGKMYDLAIFDVFYDSWVNYMHVTDKGICWFLQGGGMRWAMQGGSSPDKNGRVTDGGYFKGVLPADEESEFFNSEYVCPYGAYSGWEGGPSSIGDARIHENFSKLLIRLLTEGITALSIDSHELTTWGCEVRNGLVVKVFITNSDDGGRTLATYDVYAKDGRVHLKDYPGKTQFPTQIIRLTALKAYPD